MSSTTGKLLVLDEWLLHDLRGDLSDQNEAYRFLRRLQESPDRIVVVEGSPWIEKAYKLMRDSGDLGQPELRTFSKLLQSVLWDSSCCLRLAASETSHLNPTIAVRLPRKDLYLIETYLRSSADVLVTQD